MNFDTKSQRLLPDNVKIKHHNADRTKLPSHIYFQSDLLKVNADNILRTKQVSLDATALTGMHVPMKRNWSDHDPDL